MNNYKYIGLTTSMCEECLNLIPTKIVTKGNDVFFYKECKDHGIQKTLVSTDLEYYLNTIDPRIQEFSKPQNTLYSSNSCPYNCGLCKDHEQKTCMAMVELTDDCNISCSTCIAGSCPGNQKYISISDMNTIIDTLMLSQGNIDLLMLSGGEPTIHPQILEFIDLCKNRGINHLMIISNGVRISQDEEFVRELAKRKEGLEIYLQFDSLNRESLLDIRGIDLLEIRKKAVEKLEEFRIHSTLVCIIKKGTNDHEIKEIIDFARCYKFIRGITFQPLKDIGRGNYFDKGNNYITLTEVRERIIETGYFSKEDLIPHPCNSSSICIGYLNSDNVPVTKYLYDEFENRSDLKKLMYYIPKIDTEKTKYDDLFRVTIVSFLDKYNFNLTDVKKSCIHFVSSDRKIVPFETHYIYYS